MKLFLALLLLPLTALSATTLAPGTYTVATCPTVPPTCTAPNTLINGVCTPPVVTPPVGGIPKLDYVIYQNGAPVPLDDSWAMQSVNYHDTTGQPQGGKADIAVTLASPNGGWQPLFVPNGSTSFFDLTPYNYLLLSIKPPADNASYWIGFAGNLDTADGIQIEVAGPGFTKYGPAPKNGVWASYKIPLADFKMTSKSAVFKFGVADGTGLCCSPWYIDSVGLTKN